MTDKTDGSIISILRKDSRASNVAIAREVGLTEGAVRRRIERLLADGTISRFTIDVAPGGSFHAIVMVKSKEETKRMMADIVLAKVARDAYEIAGEYDGCVLIDGSSLEELDERIDKIRKIPSVADTRSFISLRRYAP